MPMGTDWSGLTLDELFEELPGAAGVVKTLAAQNCAPAHLLMFLQAGTLRHNLAGLLGDTEVILVGTVEAFLVMD